MNKDIKKILGSKNAKVGLGILAVAVLVFVIYNSSSKSSSARTRQETLIESKGLAEFSPENDSTADAVSRDDKKLGESLLAIIKLSGDNKDTTKNKQAIDKLGGFIRQYPTYPDAYLLRVSLKVTDGDTDYAGMLGDIDAGIKNYPSPKYKSSLDSTASMYALRAKVDMLGGNYTQALDDIENANKADIDGFASAFNTGGVSPDKPEYPTALLKSDFDLLVSKYPNDYRAPLFRGLFYNSFSFYDNQYYKSAIDDFNTAISIKPNSALPYYYLGGTYQKVALFIYSFKLDGGTAAYDNARDSMNTKALANFNQALKIDPSFKEAYGKIAESYFELKQYSNAIPNYDAEIKLDPNNAGAYNDRGLSKTSMNDYFGAVSDFSDAIRLKKAGSLSVDLTYENKGDAYMKEPDYNEAIDAYSHAIGQKISQQVFIMSLPQIRTMYSEFADISDADLLEGLRQKYYPNMSSADFVDNYNHGSINKDEPKKPNKDFVLGDVYAKRGDAYIQAGKFKNAAEDYARANYEGSTVDRWKVLSTSSTMEYSIDTQTMDFSQGDLVSLWVKMMDTSTQGYYQQNFQIDCSNRKLKSLSSTSYDSYGNVLGTFGEQGSQTIAPETFGETLYNGACLINK